MMSGAKLLALKSSRRYLLSSALKSGVAVIIGLTTSGSRSSAKTNDEQQPASMLHTAINVADIERTTRFYTGAFGFKASPPIKPDAQAARIYELPSPLEVKARILSLGHARLLVRQFDKPKYNGPARQLPVIYPGWGDIALRVRDLDQVLSNVRRLGGSVLEKSRTVEGTPEKPGPEVVFVLDPDGARIELVRF